MKHARNDYNRIQDPENKIPKDEPVFLLRGKDICAPAAIEAWCIEAARNNVDPKMIEAAHNQADAMLLWQQEYESQTPDMPNQ